MSTPPPPIIPTPPIIRDLRVCRLSILKPLDERYREQMNTMKAERKGKTPYAEKLITHVPSGWCVHSTFAYENVLDPLKMYRGKDCVEKFIEHIKDEVKRL